MLSFKTCSQVPMRGGRGYGGGGLVEVEGRVVWGGYGGVYEFDEVRSKWKKVADSGELGGRLVFCGGRIVWVGGVKDGVSRPSTKVMELSGERWFVKSEMLVGCRWSCVLSVSGGGMVVMGGLSDGDRLLNDVQVYNGETQTWNRGPSLPQPCWAMSAVVHGDLVVVMGGHGLDREVWSANIRDLTTARTHDTHQSIWQRRPDVPYYYSSICVVEGVLLVIGGAEDKNGCPTSRAVYGFHHYDETWKHIGDIPFKCSFVDTLLLSGGGLLMVDGSSTQQVLKITVKDVQTMISSLSDNYQSCTLKELTIEKLIFYGTPRAGKTTLRKALLGDADASKLSSTPQPSTNIAEMCGQVIVERILASKGEKNDDELKWTVVQLGDMGNTLLKCMYSETFPQHPRDPKPSHSMPRGQENVNEEYCLSHSDSALNSSPTQVADTVQDLSQITSIVNHVEGTNLAISPTIQESHPSLSIDVKRLIREAAKTDEWSKVLSALHISDKPMLLIQVIDGGGQPSFQEIFPLFISGPSVTLFMFKLTDDLENPVPVEYQPKDNAGKHRWEDTYVVKEYVFHALSSLASLALDATLDSDKVKNNQFRPQVLLVGTYRDELPGSEDDKKAAVQHCNRSIVDWVRHTTTFRKAIDVSNNEHTLVTDISNLEPNDIRNIKKKVESKMLERELQSIPARLLVFDFILHKHAVKHNIRKVEKTEYEAIAKLCGIESDQIEKTLNYLHHKVGTLLYYPKITELKQCVIVDFQLIFDSVSNIIVKHFVNTEVQTSPHDKGQFEVSVLKEIECCLSIEELIALLKHRQVISPFGDGKYFMPSVLTKNPDTKPSDASSCSFLLFFKNGSCPVGLFCAVASRLIFTDTSTSSSPQWELKKTEQFRNKITFHVSLHGRWHTVVFTAFSAHYEVKLLEKDSPSKLKLAIYTTINNLISNICKDLHFPSPLYGFYCPSDCEYDGNAYERYQHPAECKFSSESTQMKCHCTDSCSDLSPEQKMWFPEVHSEDQRRGVPTVKLLTSLPIPGDGAKRKNLNIIQRTSTCWYWKATCYMADTS